MLLIEDRALLDAYRRGEPTALERVYRAYAKDLAGFLRRGFSFNSGGRGCRFNGVRSEFDLEDRLHDVFGRAFSESARLSYDGLTPYRAYLLTIARNLVIDEFRKKENTLLTFSIDQHENVADTGGSRGAHETMLGQFEPSGDPERDTVDAELIGLVGEFKASLEGREREVFRLRYEDELEHKDIAEKTGLSPSKIKTSEGRIRERFYKFMTGHGYFKDLLPQSSGWLTPFKARVARSRV